MVSERTNGPLAVELRGVCKRYGVTPALDGLDLEVGRGACFGLLGPNGAGKTTAVGILTTLLRPDAGTARVLGRDVTVEPAEVRRLVGLVFQEPSLDPELTARETLDLTARLYHLADRRSRVAQLLAALGLEAVADRAVRGYSGGLKRRLEIARGLLHRPQLLFLDEPTLGLDVAARAAVWEHVRALHRERGTTVFLTTHSMEEADALCQRLCIVDRGRVVVEGSPDALKAGLGGDVLRLRLERGERAEERLLRVAGVRAVARGDDGQLWVTVEDGTRRLAPLVETVRDLGILEVDLRRPSLESVFLHHTGHAFEPPAGEAAA
jgi:ABC-2 type transport system ATP-binding protein